MAAARDAAGADVRRPLRAVAAGARRRLSARTAAGGPEVKLWKKSCGDNCPGFYKVYMNCEGHFGGGGMGPHCYLQFWCTKSNTDETYHDC